MPYQYKQASRTLRCSLKVLIHFRLLNGSLYQNTSPPQHTTQPYNHSAGHSEEPTEASSTFFDFYERGQLLLSDLWQPQSERWLFVPLQVSILENHTTFFVDKVGAIIVINLGNTEMSLEDICNYLNVLRGLSCKVKFQIQVRNPNPKSFLINQHLFLLLFESSIVFFTLLKLLLGPGPPQCMWPQ